MPAPSIVWDAGLLEFAPECATMNHRAERDSWCIVESVADAAGDVHVFMAARPLLSAWTSGGVILHYVLSRAGVRLLDPIPAVNAPATAFKAVRTPEDDLLLLWAESQAYKPNRIGQALYLQRWRNGVWQERIPVVDEKGEPSVLRESDIALVAHSGGAIDVYWTDLREKHWFADFLAACPSGGFRKTYRRRRADGVWSSVERVQSRGTFRPDDFEALSVTKEAPQILWSSSAGSYASITRTALTRDRWKDRDQVARCKSPIGDAMILDIEVGAGNGEAPQVAWICTGFEVIGSDNRKNESVENLRISTLTSGGWETGPVLSRHASLVRWIWSAPPHGLLLVQESRFRGYRAAETAAPLFVDTIEGSARTARVLISEQSLDGLTTVAVGPDDVVHLIYSEPAGETAAVMLYRRGRLLRP